MNNIIPFNYQDQTEIRVIMQGDEPWFVAKDVCGALELSDVSMATRNLDTDEKGTSTVGTPGGNQHMTIVSEAGLYSLIFQSRKPEAKQFKRWVTHEVLPSIRKTGGYHKEPAATTYQSFEDAMSVALDRYKKMEKLQDKAVRERDEVLVRLLEMEPKAKRHDALYPWIKHVAGLFGFIPKPPIKDQPEELITALIPAKVEPALKITKIDAIVAYLNGLELGASFALFDGYLEYCETGIHCSKPHFDQTVKKFVKNHPSKFKVDEVPCKRESHLGLFKHVYTKISK
jgi:prophage antirepressor-like protein